MTSERFNVSRGVIALGIGAAIAAAAILSALYFRFERDHPSTDDAYVDANVIQIVSQVSGPIATLAIEDNQPVAAGDLLFEIDPRPFEIAVEHARAQLDKTGQSVSGQADSVVSAEAQLQRARASLQLAEVQFRRIEPLAKRGALPLQDRDRAQAQLDEARSGVSHAQSQLQRARDELGELGEDNADTRIALAQLENAQLQLSYARVTAPVNALVTNLALSPGSYARTGSRVLSLIDSDSVRIVAYMREEQLRKVEPGQLARVYLPAYPGVRFDGVVQGIGWGVGEPDEQTGPDGLPSVEQTVDWVRLAQRFPVRITLAEPDTAYPLRKGMSATVRIEAASSPATLREDER